MAFHVHDGEAFARDALQAIQCVVPAMLSVGAGRGGARVSGACVFWTALRRRFATTLCWSECVLPSLRLPEGQRPVRVSANCILLHLQRWSDPVTRGKRGQLSADSIIDGGPIDGREPSRLRQEAHT